MVLEPASGERRLGELIQIVGRSRLAEPIVARATAVLQRLGRAAAPGYEDAARLARERGVPLAVVYRAAAV